MRASAPAKTKSPLDAIGESLATLANKRRRQRAAVAACICAALALASWHAHIANERSQRQIGAREADAAAADARRAMSLWTPERGYKPLMGRSFQSAAPWGAAQRLEVLAQGSGISIDYAFSSRAQCEGLVSAAGSFFDSIFVDGAPAKPLGAAPDASACKAMGQNAVRLAKLDPRADAQGLSAGSMDDARGGVIPQAAQPAPPSSGPAPGAPDSR